MALRGLDILEMKKKHTPLVISLFSPSVKIVIYQTDNLVRFVTQFIREHKLEGTYPVPPDHCDGVVLRDLEAHEKNVIYVVLEGKVRLSTIAHEAYHVAYKVNEAFDIHSEEFVAYLTGNLTEAIVDWLKTKRNPQ